MVVQLSQKRTVFISYSHQDKSYLDRLQIHLKQHVRAGTINVWDDTRLQAGQQWREEIAQALESAHVAILLVSADYLASDFVTGVEVPQLLAVARARGVRILPVILSPCGFLDSTLSSYEAVNSPAKTLSSMTSHDQDDTWERVVREVRATLGSDPQSPAVTRGVELKGKTVIFKDHRDAILAAIDLLEKLPPLNYQRVAPIKITVQGSTIFKSLGTEEHQNWSQARIQALKKGWSMVPYWRLNEDNDRTERWVKDMLVVLQAGSYRPQYFLDRERDLLRPPYDLMLIPGSQGRPAQAVAFFATNNQDFVDAAIVSEDEEFYQVLDRHLQQLAVSARPLFEIFPSGERSRFLNEMEKRETQGGERLLVKPDLAVLTIPIDFYMGETPWTARAKHDGWEEGQLFRLQQQRRRGLLQGTVHYRDVCSKRALKEWVRTCKYSAYQSLGSEMPVEPHWIRRHLRHAIDMLDQYPHYEIALLDDEGQEESFLPPLWMVAGKRKGEAVFVEVLQQDDGQLKNSLNVRIDEERVVRAFIGNFEQLWQKHALPKDKKRNEVKKWLESLLAEIPADS